MLCEPFKVLLISVLPPKSIAMTASRITLYGIDMSPPVRAVRLTLAALDLPYEYVQMNPLAGETMSPEYLKKNPQHTIPTLEDDGQFIWDSHAIIAYLVRKYGKTDALYPKDFLKRAVVDQRLHYENGILFVTCIRHVISPVFKGASSKAEFESKKKIIEDAFDMLETFLENHSYMAGDELTLADLSIITSVSSLTVAVPLDDSKHSKLQAWIERLKQLPYYQEANGVGAEKIKEFVAPLLAALK